MIYDQSTQSSFCEDRMHLSKDQVHKIDAAISYYKSDNFTHNLDDVLANIAPIIETPEEGFYFAITIGLLLNHKQ